jgi:hypothetical protein
MKAAERLKIIRAERRDRERELKAERAIEMEKELQHQADVELARMKLTEAQRRAINDRGEKRFDSKYISDKDSRQAS